jgi:hypothetical protein
MIAAIAAVGVLAASAARLPAQTWDPNFGFEELREPGPVAPQPPAFILETSQATETGPAQPASPASQSAAAAPAVASVDCGPYGYDGADCGPHGACLYDYFGVHPGCCLHGWLPFDGAATHSPDYGWVRPVKFPIRPVPVEYHRYWPTRWYGEPGTVPPAPTYRQFPMVFMPTDTTQLGYYYQRAPIGWRPNPGMIPPPPWPTDWHHREYFQADPSGPVGAAVMSTAAPASPQPPPQVPVLPNNGNPQPSGGDKKPEAPVGPMVGLPRL